MKEVKGKPGELRATIHVKRKATGKVETFEVVGTTTPPAPKEHGAAGAITGPASKLTNEEQ